MRVRSLLKKRNSGFQGQIFIVCVVVHTQIGAILRGVLLMWHSRVAEKVEECKGEYTVACKFKKIDTIDADRTMFQNDLVGLLSW